MLLTSDITQAFDIPAGAQRIELFGNGLINDTFLLTIQGPDSQPPARFIFQRINHRVFKNPVELMENVQRVCDHIESIVSHDPGANPQARHLKLVKTIDGSNLHQAHTRQTDQEVTDYWRCFHYIEESTSHDTVHSPEIAYQAAKQFGEFQRLLATFHGKRLHETIPDFHHTPKRLQAFREAVARNPLDRAKSCLPEIRFALDHSHVASHLMQLHASGLIPERITHNDTKISNVLICNRTQQGLCVVDLDTVMPGLSLHDFGDLARSCVSPTTEDEPDLSAIHIRIPYYRALATGFLDSMGDTLTPVERENLSFAPVTLAYELGLRFLTDHLLGDTYFHTTKPNHNLIRAKNQFHLANLLITQQQELQKFS